MDRSAFAFLLSLFVLWTGGVVPQAQIVPPDPGALPFDLSDPVLCAQLDPDGDGVLEVDLCTQGAYDAEKWCVVFSYASVYLPAGKTLRFKNHPTRAPVAWLVQGDVVIDGVLDLSGARGGWEGYYSDPGPGGFRGGRGQGVGGGVGWLTSSGFGPGGGFHYQFAQVADGAAASHMTPGGADGYGSSGPLYGHGGVSRLTGGSGGAGARIDSGGCYAYGGGAGGGAILIASNSKIEVAGQVSADGGGANGAHCHAAGGGSGGAIRMVADAIELHPGAAVRALGGASSSWLGGAGWIRFEYLSSYQEGVLAVPPPSLGTPEPLFPVATAPSIRVEEVEGVDIRRGGRYDPQGNLGQYGRPADLSLTQGGMKLVRIVTVNVPLDWQAYLRVTRAQGAAAEIMAGPLTLTNADPMVPSQAEAFVTVDLQNGYTSLLARAVMPVPGR